MRVLVVVPPIMDDFGQGLESIAMDAIRECPPYGAYLLHATLMAHGHNAVLADLIGPGTASIDQFDLDGVGLVALSATSMSWPTALRVIAQVREREPSVHIVVGGIHPSMFDGYLLSTFAIDSVVRGEGEIALIALADALERGSDLTNIGNLTWKAPNGQIIRNPAGRQLTGEQLSQAPVPDYSLMPENTYLGLSIESSRGCAFDCSFCSTSYRKSFRGMPPGAFVDRLQEVLKFQNRTVHPFTHIVDDEFSMNVGRAIAIARVIDDRNMSPSLVYDSRATDLLVLDFVEAMAPFTYQFLVGAECGYDEGLKKIGKGTTTATLREAARVLQAQGLADRADFSFVIGLPWETKAEVRRTCTFALELQERYGVRVLLQWYCQIPGSRLWQDARDNGDVTEAMYNEHGFFRDLYLFRSGVKLTNDEIDYISRRVRLAAQLASARAKGRSMIEYAHPEPLRIYYPTGFAGRPSDALGNLRELARADHRRPADPVPVALTAIPGPTSGSTPNALAGRPQRHFTAATEGADQ